jgi:hypothetical protein
VAPLYTPTGECLYTVDNFGATPSATPGTSVVPGASNAEGSFSAALLSPTQDLAGLYLRVSDGGATTASKPHLLDIGVDPAGGTSFAAVISNIVCGASGSLTAGGAHRFFFPLFVPAGATVAVRIQGANATAGTVIVGLKGYGQLHRRHMLPVGTFSETLGTITNSSGVSFTPGNASDGTWVSLGTTAKHMWFFQLAYQITGGTITAERTWIELGAGPSGSQRVLLRRGHNGTATEQIGDMMDTQLVWHEGYHEIPAGTELWVRGRCENAPDSGYDAVAIGIGG